MGYSHNMDEKRAMESHLKLLDKQLDVFIRKIEKTKSLEDAVELYKKRNMLLIKRNALHYRMTMKKSDELVYSIKIVAQN